MTQYLIRLDDICPTMKREPFLHLTAACKTYGVTGILGVVPDNQNPKLVYNQPDPHFWRTIKSLAEVGWIVAQHGYQHTYTTSHSGILKLRSRSEFSGLPYEVQYAKIAAGKKILEEQLQQPIYWWMAPAHSFDQTTCKVLVDLNFTHITDGVSLYPLKQYGLTWIPHQTWKPQTKPFGFWTIGLHLNTISDARLSETVTFIRRHASRMRSPDFTSRVHWLNPFFRAYWYSKFRILKAVL